MNITSEPLRWNLQVTEWGEDTIKRGLAMSLEWDPDIVI